MITIENLTDKQQYDIAEFIFAHESDTLIKPEAEALIRVFQEHHVPESFVANLSIEDCIDSAYNEIKGRKGKMNNGTFVKNTL